MTAPVSVSAPASPIGERTPLLGGERTPSEHVLVHVFILVPFLALVVAVPLAWGWGLSWLDVELAGGFYMVTGLAVTVGFHRHFTHGAFKANRGLRFVLAALGIMAVQGPVTEWVADHRRHHAFSDRQGDPHSPWLYGTSPLALARGFWHAHLGWIFDRGKTNLDRFAPDLVADRHTQAVDQLFVLWTVLTFGLPALLGGVHAVHRAESSAASEAELQDEFLPWKLSVSVWGADFLGVVTHCTTASCGVPELCNAAAA